MCYIRLGEPYAKRISSANGARNVAFYRGARPFRVSVSAWDKQKRTFG